MRLFADETGLVDGAGLAGWLAGVLDDKRE
jgi:hypothetical protein